MGAGDNVAHMAHIAGLLVGVGFGYIMKNQPRAYYR
jgi:membrane associated rhomboid family serine protease